MQYQPLNKLVESLIDAVIVLSKPARRIIYVNRAACEMFGYPLDELVGSTTDKLHVDEAHSRQFREWTMEVLASEPHFRGEFRMRRANGEVFATHHTVSLFTDEDGTEYAVSVVRDISEQKAQEKTLRESELIFRQIAENLREVFWVSNPEKTRMEYVSPAFEWVWGMDPESLYRDPMAFARAIHPEDRMQTLKQIELQSSQDYDARYRIIRPDGEVRWIWDRGVPIRDEHGKVYRVVGVAEDITELKHQEEELLQGRKMDALGQLTGGIAHDFNNMLTVIMGNVELISERLKNDPDSATLARSVLEASRRARDLIGRLMAFARQQSLQREALDLADLIRQFATLVRRTLREDIEINLAVAEDLWPVLADRAQIETCLLNIAFNARDAMPDGGALTIKAWNHTFEENDVDRPASLSPGDHVVTTISDTGTGISPDSIDRVFDPFFTTKQPGEGTGMGLSMTYAIVRESGGHVDVESRPGHGATFRICLPRMTEPAPANALPDHDATMGGNETILVVEDEAMVRNLIASKLGVLGYRVIEAADGPEALSQLERNEDIALLFSDVIMPGGLSGPELYVRARERHPDLKVLFCSGYGAQDAISGSKLPDDIPVLAKPFRQDQLASAVRQAIDH